VRAQGLKPWTYGLKVPAESLNNCAFETGKTKAKNQVSNLQKTCAQQKAQHFSSKVRSRQKVRGNEVTIEDQPTPITSNPIEYLRYRWEGLLPEIRAAILTLAKNGAGNGIC